MFCPDCQAQCRKFGKNRNGSQRYRCDDCSRTFTDESTRQDRRRISRDTVVMCLRMLLEGASVRSVERLTGAGRDAIIAWMVEAGQNCARWMQNRLLDLYVNDVECDEIWGFIFCKERHRVHMKLRSEEIGDAYCFTAIERNTKLLFAWHLGKRDMDNTKAFMTKVDRATTGRYQLSTDAFPPYRVAVRRRLRHDVDYATIKKEYENEAEDFRRRYSPPKMVFVFKNSVQGNPDMERVGTSIIERSNLSIRMAVRRMTRLTNAHSKKWENHEAMLGLFFAYYNFCRVHSTLKQTPAMAHRLAVRPWTVDELLIASS
jgi:transposase-like protein/IS1 family transposase